MSCQLDVACVSRPWSVRRYTGWTFLSEGGPNVSRSLVRTFVAVTAVAALALVAGCSLLPFGSSTPPPAPPAAPSATANTSATPAATSSPVVSKTSSGTAVPVPGLPKMTSISSDIDGIELRDLQRKGALVVDLRPRADFKKEHISGAENVPLADFTQTASGWRRSRVIVVYDESGPEGQSAQSWLERNKFTAIYHLFRGLKGYDAKLAGTAPTPIPPKMPVVYYFYIDPSDKVPLSDRQLGTYDQNAVKTANKFIADLRDEFDGKFEYDPYKVTTIEGLSTFLEFGGTDVPMIRLVDEKGHAEQFTGLGTLQTVRSHLKKAIDAYEKETAQ